MDDVETRSALEGPGLLESIRQYLYLAIAIVLLFGALGAAASVASPKSYSTTARVGLVDQNPNAGTTGSSRNTAAVAEEVSSDAVLERAVKDSADLGLPARSLRGACDATASADAPVVFIACSAGAPQEAADRTNAVANALTAVLGDQTNKRFATLDAALGTLEKRYQPILTSPRSSSGERQVALNALNAIQAKRVENSQEKQRQQGGVQFTTPALVPFKSGMRAIATKGAMGGLVGAIVAVIVCWVLADRRRLVEDAEVPARVTGTRLLGEIPTVRGAALRALHRFAEMPAPPFGFVAAGLWGSVESGVVVVSGVEHEAGATTTAASVAAAFARDGRRVVVVDADGRSRGMSRLAGVSDSAFGLSDVLARRAPIEDSLRAVELGDGASVAVLGAGRPEPDLASLLRTRTMGETVERLREWYDLVIVDTPPITSEPEAASLARYADGLLLVIARNTRLRRLTRLRERLVVINVPTLGYVFNRDQRADVTVVRTASPLRS